MSPTMLYFCLALGMLQVVLGGRRQTNATEQAEWNTTGKQAMDALHSTYTKTTMASLGRSGNCTRRNISIRREWGDLHPRERKEYLSAVQCLQRLPAKTSTDLVPGARNHWDDFVAAHLINTPKIHFNAWLFPWHRHFVWTMEQTLRNECNYTGSQPYWNWSRLIDTAFSDNPIFDGSDTSFGGDGIKSSSNDTLKCITDGPFKNWTANLGPLPLGKFQILPQPQPNSRQDGLAYNPRCLERAFNTTELSTFMRYEQVAGAISQSSSADDFLLAVEYNNGSVGAHGHPHRFTGGTMRDVAVSPSDPIFFMHHAMLVRMWAIWQGQDLEKRSIVIGNAKEILDPYRTKGFGWPASEFGTLESVLYMSGLWKNVTMGDVRNPTAGRYCYVYA